VKVHTVFGTQQLPLLIVRVIPLNLATGALCVGLGLRLAASK
jgi:hypothetical protein